MPDAVWFCFAVAVNALAFGVGWSLGRRRKAALPVFLLVVHLLASKGVLNWRPDWEFALFSFPDYLFVQSWLGYPIGLLAMGLGVGLLRSFRDRRALAVLAAIATEKLMHVVVVRFHGDEATVHDPAWPSPRTMAFDEYRDAYGGFAVVAEPLR